ncbi:MAG: hypothetical protein JNK54_07840 [Elusimicrobia bacterium]|nr:hypothetical protein [Elusimicrobiota bacterium]
MKYTSLKVAALALGILSACSSHKFTDVSGDPAYVLMMNRAFEVKVELAVFKTAKGDDQLRVNIPGSPGIPATLPNVFPYDEGGVFVVGSLPQGSVFKITRAVRVQSFENDYVGYKAVVVSTGPLQGKEVDPTGLTDRGDIPHFNPAYVSPVNGE